MNELNPFDQARLDAYREESRRRVTAAMMTIVGLVCALLVAYMAGKSEYTLQELRDSRAYEQGYKDGWNDCYAEEPVETSSVDPFAEADRLSQAKEDLKDLRLAEGVIREIERIESGGYAGNPFENYR